MRRGTIRYSERNSDLSCPVCDEQMAAFNYRAYDLELDTCRSEHGFWLDAGEEGRVRDIIDERVRGLQRSATAEAAWGNFLDGLGGAAREAPGAPCAASSAAGGADAFRPAARPAQPAADNRRMRPPA